MFKIEAFRKHNRSHIVDISESRASLTGEFFFPNNEDFGLNGILGQAPSAKAGDKRRLRSSITQILWISTFVGMTPGRHFRIDTTLVEIK